MCMPLLNVELRDVLFGQGTLLITIVAQLLANEGVPRLTAPVSVWQRHLNFREVFSMPPQDSIEEPKSIVIDVLGL